MGWERYWLASRKSTSRNIDTTAECSSDSSLAERESKPTTKRRYVDTAASVVAPLRFPKIFTAASRSFFFINSSTRMMTYLPSALPDICSLLATSHTRSQSPRLASTSKATSECPSSTSSLVSSRETRCVWYASSTRREREALPCASERALSYFLPWMQMLMASSCRPTSNKMSAAVSSRWISTSRLDTSRAISTWRLGTKLRANSIARSQMSSRSVAESILLDLAFR
mmetsp:Transcript_28083/g.47250  ORF Transcript_28083/g.47250 Transcript_28083/m.47250 type:complete len:228 (-) Transcript_28083:4098-4781(-)